MSFINTKLQTNITTHHLPITAKTLNVRGQWRFICDYEISSFSQFTLISLIFLGAVLSSPSPRIMVLAPPPSNLSYLIEFDRSLISIWSCLSPLSNASDPPRWCLLLHIVTRKEDVDIDTGDTKASRTSSALNAGLGSRDMGKNTGDPGKVAFLSTDLNTTPGLGDFVFNHHLIQ